MNVLITGGAGFIGSHLADGLIERGYEVRVFDNLEPQVHKTKVKPAYLNKKVKFIRGDVKNRKDLNKALDGVDAVFHFAANVGIGQSQYQPRRYVETNLMGTANLIEALIERRSKSARVVMAGSMSVYGEGDGFCPEHKLVRPKTHRREKDMAAGKWEPRCPFCDRFLDPRPVTEDSCPNPVSVYAVTKLSQEQMMLSAGAAHGLAVTSLRFFNVYGARQALSNPYTGVAAIFISRIKHGRRPVVFEDGAQTRDFVHVSDVVRACIAAIERDEAVGEVINVGTGKATSVADVAEIIEKTMGSDIKTEITRRFRKGDVRHCIAGITLAKRILNFKPRVSLEDGFKELAEWAAGETCEDLFDDAHSELVGKGLAPKLVKKSVTKKNR